MGFFKTTLVIVLFVAVTKADDRQKRQSGQYGGQYSGAAPYRQQEQPQAQSYQPQAQSYQPQGYERQQVQQYPAQPPPRASRPSRPVTRNEEEEEEEKGPHPLQVLLEGSKFECGSKGDGYYADSDVGCQAFHYCVGGAKHSMMCPQGTVFHQVHLNCVPADQDICSKANKFYFVNDYLNKQLEQRGPNNTVQYAQRYYPENYAVGDPFIPPQESNKRDPPAATYGLGPAYREQAPPQQAYQPQPQSYQPQPQQYQQPAAPRPAPRPQPAAYAPQPQANYPVQQRPRPQIAHQPQAVQYGYGAQQQQAYQAQAQQAQRAYAQQQQQAAQPPPQQNQYAQQAQRQRYA